MADRAAVHFDTLCVWRDGKLVAEIPRDDFPALIVGMAKALQERKPVDMTENQRAIVRRIVRVAKIIEKDSRQEANAARAAEIIALAELLTEEKG
jgi:hypothetical protein